MTTQPTHHTRFTYHTHHTLLTPHTPHTTPHTPHITHTTHHTHHAHHTQLRYAILQHLPTELQQLYQLLEVEYNPLQLCKKVMPILEGLTGHEPLEQYVEPLKEITLVRLIKQVGERGDQMGGRRRGRREEEGRGRGQKEGEKGRGRNGRGKRGECETRRGRE